MSEQLKTMLRDAADNHPELGLHGDLWRRGRRLRLRRQLAGGAGAVVTAAAAVAGTVLLTTPDLTSAPEPAQDESVEPALPDTLYEVPPNIADISEDPLGEPAAAVYYGSVRTGWFSGGERPLVVGAESGEVRAVREAGLTHQSVLSPDGTKLAVGDAWSPGVEPDDGPSTVLVVDLLDGESTRFALPDQGLGGAIEELVWAADSSRIAVTIDVVTRLYEDGYEGQGEQGWLELPDGEWNEHELGRLHAVSDDGSRMVVDGLVGSGQPVGLAVRDVDGDRLTELEMESTPWRIAFAPDGQRLATVTFRGGTYSGSDPYRLEIYDASTGRLTDQVELGEYAGARIVGWGESGILVHTIGAGGATTGAVERIQPTGTDTLVRETVSIDQSGSRRIGVAAAFVDAGTRESSPPDAGFDWVGWAPRAIVVCILGAIAAGVGYFLRRRRGPIAPAEVDVDAPERGER